MRKLMRYNVAELDNVNLHQKIRQQLLNNLNAQSIEDMPVLNDSFRLLAKWRSVLIANTIIQQQGTIVSEGPFAGLDYLAASSEGCLAARLLGCYEQPLLPYIEAAMQEDYAAVVNVGCADGYYCVGMARRMPNTKMYAYDINPEAQKACLNLAEKNQVAERVEIGALFTPAEFAQFAHKHTLVVCDIEGAEKDLLDPVAAPALKNMDIIVESHDCIVNGMTDTLLARFSDTHDITVIHDNGLRALSSNYAWLESWSHMDQLTATWEWRAGPTPWMVMKSKQPLA